MREEAGVSELKEGHGLGALGGRATWGCSTHQQHAAILPKPVENPKPHGCTNNGGHILVEGVHVRRVEAYKGRREGW